MKHRISSLCKCPFYRHEDTQVIYCDGVQRDSVIHLAFANGSDAKDYKTRICQANHKACPIYQMLEDIRNED